MGPCPTRLGAARFEWLLAHASLFELCRAFSLRENGGARRDRTDDLLNANQALFQLSYGPEYSVECESELLKEQGNLFSVTNCNPIPRVRDFRPYLLMPITFCSWPDSP